MKTLNVVCNPFAGLDHEGVPSGAYPFDPEHGAGARRWVGATLDTARIVKVPLKSTDVLKGRQILFEPLPRQRTFYAFDLSPQKVLDTPHYRRGVAQGDLFASDAETSLRLGEKTFVPTEKRLADARTKAVADWTATYGTPPDVELWPQNLRFADRTDDLPTARTASTEIAKTATQPQTKAAARSDQ